MTQDQLFEMAIAYADSINAIVFLICLLPAKHFGILQHF